MSKDFRVTVFEGTQRAETFMQVFGRLEVCVKSFIPEEINMAGFDEPQLAYWLDLDEITSDERTHMIDYLANRFSLSPQEIESYMNDYGVPIRAAECIVTVLNPQKWVD